MKPPALLAATMLLMLMLAVAGCGGDDKADGPRDNGIATMSPADAVEASYDAAAELEDVTYRASLTRPDGTRYRGTATAVAGGRCSLDVGGTEIGRLRVLMIGKQTYGFVTQRAFAQTGVSSIHADRLVGKWVRSRTSADQLRDCRRMLVLEEARSRTFRDVKLAEVDGHPVRVLRGKDRSGHPMTLFIATTGDPLALRAQGHDEDGEWSFELASTNIGSVISAPRPGEIAR